MTTPAVPDRDDWFSESDGFPRPDWRAIMGWMRAYGCYEKAETWHQMVRHWLGRLGAALGGKYAVMESAHFHFLTSQDESARRRMLAWLEKAQEQMCRTLGEVAWTSAMGKHVVLRFATDDEYFRYISYRYPNGEHASSSGVYIHDYYTHIAFMESYNGDSERTILAHELAHNLLGHLPMPLWLNEALAMAFDGDLGGTGRQQMDRTLEKEHREFWNAETIQQFWAGRSFGTIDGQRVSYNLAQILLEIIYRDLRPPQEDFRRFVLQADREDAGVAAAREQLDVNLGELAGVFLGEGDWEPHPKSWKWDESMQKDGETEGADESGGDPEDEGAGAE